MLSKKAPFEFKSLFDVVHANLRARNAASGGEEMLRLRLYEKLQNFVQAGFAKKTGKEYRGVTKGLETFLSTAAELNARFAAGTHSRPPVLPEKAPIAPVAPVAVAKTPAVKAAKAKAPKAKAKATALKVK